MQNFKHQADKGSNKVMLHFEEFSFTLPGEDLILENRFQLSFVNLKFVIVKDNPRIKR